MSDREWIVREARRGLGETFTPVCSVCGAELRRGEPRAVVRQRFVICAACLYARQRRGAEALSPDKEKD